MNQQETDPFLLEVLRNAFDTIAEEITLTIIRTAYSQIVRDSLDFSTALCDAKGRTLATKTTCHLIWRPAMVPVCAICWRMQPRRR